MINDSIAKGKWNEFKGEVQKAWGKITGDELEQTKGNVKSIAGILEQKYGVAKEEASQKIADLAARFQDKAQNASDDLKHKANVKSEQIKDDLKNS